MELVRRAAPWILALNWILISGILAWNHLRVQRMRHRRGIAEEKPSLRDPRSMRGLALEGLGFLIAVLFPRPHDATPDWRHAASITFGVLAVALVWWALRHLGLEWRVKAVVTQDHRLVTTGPYALLRHPIFAALLCLLLATALLITRPWAAALAVAVCLYGTEIRIRAEDGLLEQRFGARFSQYKARVAAYLPFVR